MTLTEILLPSTLRTTTRNPSLPPTAQTVDTQTATEPREFRRVIGYHNILDVYDPNEPTPDEEEASQHEPPTYEVAVFRPPRRRLPALARLEEGSEALPGYTCSVAVDGVVGLKFEQVSPFDAAERAVWTDVFAVLTGTMLKIHTVRKAASVLGVKNRPMSGAGRFLKSWTLQQAEVGMAADHPKYEMVAKSSFVHMLPDSTIERLQESEPHLFEPVRRHVIRLRVEAEQLLLRFSSSDERGRWLEKLCAAIDIAAPLEERSEPKYHTLPRRRRRQPGARDLAIALAASLADQNGVAGPQRQSGDEQDNLLQTSRTCDPDAGDLDTGLGMIDQPDTPPSERNSGNGNTANNMSTILRIFGGRDAAASSQGAPPRQAPINPIPLPLNMYASHNTRIPARIYPDEYTKWQPQFLVDTAQQMRYRRHCLPNLLYASKRANDILIKNGRRYKVDWEREQLRPWPEVVPRYSFDDKPDAFIEADDHLNDIITAEHTRLESTDDSTAIASRRLKTAAAARRRSGLNIDSEFSPKNTDIASPTSPSSRTPWARHRSSSARSPGAIYHGSADCGMGMGMAFAPLSPSSTNNTTGNGEGESDSEDSEANDAVGCIPTSIAFTRKLKSNIKSRASRSGSIFSASSARNSMASERSGSGGFVETGRTSLTVDRASSGFVETGRTSLTLDRGFVETGRTSMTLDREAVGFVETGRTSMTLDREADDAEREHALAGERPGTARSSRPEMAGRAGSLSVLGRPRSVLDQKRPSTSRSASARAADGMETPSLRFGAAGESRRGSDELERFETAREVRGETFRRDDEMRKFHVRPGTARSVRGFESPDPDAEVEAGDGLFGAVGAVGVGFGVRHGVEAEEEVDDLAHDRADEQADEEAEMEREMELYMSRERQEVRRPAEDGARVRGLGGGKAAGVRGNVGRFRGIDGRELELVEGL